MNMPDFEWFACRVAGADTMRKARELADAEHAALSVGLVIRWDPTWTCMLEPEDPDGLIACRQSVDLDAHPSEDPRGRDVERQLLAEARMSTPGASGHDEYRLRWKREVTCRIFDSNGTLLLEDTELAPRDPGSQRYCAAEIVRDEFLRGTLKLPAHEPACSVTPDPAAATPPSRTVAMVPASGKARSNG